MEIENDDGNSGMIEPDLQHTSASMEDENESVISDLMKNDDQILTMEIGDEKVTIELANSSSEIFESEDKEIKMEEEECKPNLLLLEDGSVSKTEADEFPDDENSKPSSYDSTEIRNSLSPVENSHDSNGANAEDMEEYEFIWEDYLSETGASTVPPTAFKHVEISLQSGFTKGMRLEAPNKSSPDSYWLASVVMTCGPLLRLRYEGYDNDSSADFWNDPMTSDVHPIGWCGENGKNISPPDAVKEKYPNWEQFLEETLKKNSSAPAYLLDKSTGATPVDQIKKGMRLEVQEELKPECLWLVRVLDNVGGRLRLRHEGLESADMDFWMFYLDHRLHPVGWGEKVGYRYVVPQSLIETSGKSEENLLQCHQRGLSDVAGQNLPEDIFKDQLEIDEHKFEIGMKLEAVNVKVNSAICPATVTSVVNAKYFIITIDNMSEISEKSTASSYCCYKNHPMIFPARWAESKDIKISAPRGWKEEEGAFTWDRYLDMTGAVAAPVELFSLELAELESCDHEFECGMKLEAASVDSPDQICAATVTKLVDHLVWVTVDSGKVTMDSFVAHLNSLDLFPVGWCASNGWPLTPPVRMFGAEFVKKKSSVQQPIESPEKNKSPKVKSASVRDSYGGPPIYFNHRCFSGPYLSKGRIALLPRSIGPGPVSLVMTEVLSNLINSAYKSSKVLKELQLEGKPSSRMTQQVLKAKYKGRHYRAVVEVCRTVGQLDEFCRQVCLKLQCCPHLISPHHISGSCPDQCDQQTKTKYTHYGRRRNKKVVRPASTVTQTNTLTQKKKGRPKKRFDMMSSLKEGSQAVGEGKDVNDDGEEEEEDDDDQTSVCSKDSAVTNGNTAGNLQNNVKSVVPLRSFTKRRYTHHIPPPSEIRTRGAKLPKYAFEKRTHKKIMIVEGAKPNFAVRKESKVKPSATSRQQSWLSMQLESSFLTRPATLPISLKSEPPLRLDKNPLHWTVSDVEKFLKTSDCSDRDLMEKLKSESVDGQALLLLTLPNIQDYLGLKLGPAIKLCHLIERVKIAFYETYAS